MGRVWVAALWGLLGCSTPASSAEEVQEQTASRSPAVVPNPVQWRRERLEPLGGQGVVPRPIHLLIPDAEAAEGLPFLVVTDGDLAFDDAYFGVDSALQTLVEEGKLQPWVVIAVPAIDRTPELTPSLESRRALRRGERVEDARAGVEAFADYVVEVVLPAVHERVALRPTGAALGYSFGGLAALHFGLRYPDRFQRVIAMSPSLWFSQRAALFAVDRASTLPARVWLDVGTREGDPNEDFPYMVADARQLRDDLRRREVDVGYYEAIGRPHGSNEAAPRMRDALRYALGEGECDITEVSLHAFRRQARTRHSVPTTVLGRCADGSPRTLSARDVHFEAQGGNVSVDGHVSATRAGRVAIRARASGLEASDSLRYVAR